MKIYMEISLKAIKNGQIYTQVLGAYPSVEEGVEFNTVRRSIVTNLLDLSDKFTEMKNGESTEGK